MKLVVDRARLERDPHRHADLMQASSGSPGAGRRPRRRHGSPSIRARTAQGRAPGPSCPDASGRRSASGAPAPILQHHRQHEHLRRRRGHRRRQLLPGEADDLPQRVTRRDGERQQFHGHGQPPPSYQGPGGATSAPQLAPLRHTQRSNCTEAIDADGTVMIFLPGDRADLASGRSVMKPPRPSR
jgi:hypothetical protein